MIWNNLEFLCSVEGSKEAEKEKGKKEALGSFHNLPNYMKLYDILKGAYSNYQVGK